MSQSWKLTLVTDQKNLWAGHDTAEKVLPLCKFTTELSGPIDGRVHLSREIPLRLSEGRDDIMHRHLLSDNHDVYVAAAGFTTGCHRTVNERELNLGGENSETALQNLDNAEGLPDESVQFFEYRTRAVSLEIGLPAFYGAGENPCAYELLQFPLDSARAKPDGEDNLPLIEALIRVAKQKAQHRLARGAKERRSDGISNGAACITHYGYDSTLYGFICQQ